MSPGRGDWTRGAVLAAAEIGRRWSLPKGELHRLVSRSDPGRHYFVHVPSAGGHNAPVFVAIHGISRNVDEHATLFSTFCEQLGVVLIAPHFASEQSKDYQRLGRDGRGPRADLALDAVLEETGVLTGAATDRFYLFGFSGGAQFAHRYAMAHPNRVIRAVIAAAGWYTFPDRHERFPYGIRRSRELPDLRFDPEEFLRVPMRVIVGDQDITDVDLRRTARVDRQQGETRLDRARNWVEAMRVAAHSYQLDPQVTLEIIPGADHVFANLMHHHGLGERVFAALFGEAPSTNGGNGHG